MTSIIFIFPTTFRSYFSDEPDKITPILGWNMEIILYCLLSGVLQ
ncbi:hypothetical protein CORMATOL_01008 [Corynebacterium matruchotii ATCC 33806]|uniref:Uncharacterized protein n=1 Tax=Corynebacterium matruchotii ATCC 33806 TaxID=566549 RepID=C0E203_9CORY|nr:hypothetical protein CORMATOL_01008 [Corynebacterium matruchotii ATCC 33806]